jgi:prevent-host-death family protein
MVQVQISELKAALSRYLDRVRLGEEVLVTDRGKPIARLIPLAADGLEEPGHLDALERAGVLRRGDATLPEGFWDRPRLADGSGDVRRALLDERDAR